MTKLKRGTLYISKEDILSHMKLTEDTQLSIKDCGDGIQIDVVANGNNEHEWLIDNSGNEWNLPRVKIELETKTEDWKITQAEISNAQNLVDLLLSLQKLDLNIPDSLQFIKDTQSK